MQHVKPERLWLRGHSVFTEKWVQDRIAEDPTILGLGELVLRDRERLQPRAGRLDLLLQDPETSRRYEVELQLGSTDESHIIRTIEYWDLERKRYPQYEHCAVIVAEEITSRFLNVITLFNGTIPLIAIQASLLKIGDNVALVFTKVLDELQRGLVDDDETVYQQADRQYWEARAAKETLALCDEVLKLLRTYDTKLNLNYTKGYIGLAREGRSDNFVVLGPRKDYLRVGVLLPESQEVTQLLADAGVETMTYDKRTNRYRIRLESDSLKKHIVVLTELLKRSLDASAK